MKPGASSGFAIGSKANAICERVIGTIRRECLDWMIPLSEAHLRSILREWVAHYNGGRPHSALGPGVPGPPAGLHARRTPNPDVYGHRVRSCERNPCWADCTRSTRFGRRRRSRRELQTALNGSAETLNPLKSGTTQAGWHFCGAQVPRMSAWRRAVQWMPSTNVRCSRVAGLRRAGQRNCGTPPCGWGARLGGPPRGGHAPRQPGDCGYARRSWQRTRSGQRPH
jgi:hypothetical protein